MLNPELFDMTKSHFEDFIAEFKMKEPVEQFLMIESHWSFIEQQNPLDSVRKIKTMIFISEICTRIRE